VLPAIAHVVEVGEALDVGFGEIGEADAASVCPVTANLVMEEVLVLPPHGGLNDGMEHLQRRRRRNLDPAPDGRLAVFEGDLKADNGVFHATSLADAAPHLFT